jgi:predicted nucleic acid-binding Zn ribbon protein
MKRAKKYNINRINIQPIYKKSMQDCTSEIKVLTSILAHALCAYQVCGAQAQTCG